MHADAVPLQLESMSPKNPMQAVRRKRRRTSTAAPKRRKKQKSSGKWIWILGMLVVGGIITYLGLQDRRPMSPASFRKTVPEGFAAIGIDVSHHQGNIDWEKLFTESGYDSLIYFVYCKATEGHTHIDTKWERNRKALNNLGIPNGAYHFFQPKDPPRPQAAHFLDHWKKRDIDLPPVLDVETEGLSDEDLIAKMKIWLTEIELHSGMRPVIYTSLNFYETKFQDDFKDYKFWIAAYSRKPDCIADERIIHWQYSESGKLPGCKEKVDINVSKLNF